MDVERIRELRLAEPFRPFNLVLGDGRKLAVDRPNALAMSPDGRLLVFQTFDAWFERLSPDAVASVDFDVNTLNVRRERLMESLKPVTA